MNPGTYYLYEYENANRRRNVGFIKVSRHYQSCILQIHAKGVSAGNSSALELIAFYREQEHLIGAHIADLNCCGRNIAVRLSVSEIHFPQNRSLTQIDGFLIRFAGKSLQLFWMASSFFFNVSTDMLLLTDQNTSDSPQETADEAEPPGSPQETTDEAEPPGSPQETADEAENTEEKKTSSSTAEEASKTPEKSAPGSAGEMSLESAESAELPRVKKIRRSDLSILPRRFWHLANNSFLLHGCRNYGHLLLIEENDRLWLGVPGIYDPHEARAADLFGFPRFTRAYISAAGLSENERNDGADFGHWCRCVGPCGSAGDFRQDDNVR